MSLNFDAEIKLNIGPFLASIQKAQTEVKQLSQQIDAVNKKTLSIKSKGIVSAGPTAGAAASTASGAGSAARMAASKEELAIQKEADAALRTNIKTQYEADKMWEKSYEARLKDHQTLSRTIDDGIKTEQNARKQASNSIKAQMQENANAANQAERSLARERYALYDVAAAYTMVAAAATAFVSASAGTAIAFERAFADVQRTTDFTSAKIGAAAESAKNDLKVLASEIPVAFGQITQIATIGNQLGIAQGAITSFTETVSKFSATTGVSVEQTAMAFGRIGQLLGVAPENFEKLGSAIAFAGVNAVATEEQILSVTKEIATTAKMAKFTEADIVGLATALSSLGIAPEAARGSIIRTFAGINQAISEGGDALDSYANIAGMSAEQFATSWQDNGEAAFGSFLSGLQSMSDSGQNLDTVLRDIGMKNVRDIQTVQKLGDNYDVYASSIRDANQGFREGTFLGESYSVIQETVASKLALVQNNWSNLLDSLGQGAVGEGFKALLDSVNNVLVRMNELAKTPLGGTFANIVVIAGALVGAIAAINAISALAGASLKAFAVAQGSLEAATLRSTASLGIFGKMLNAVSAASTTTAGTLNKTKLAVSAISTALNAIKWLAIISAVVVVIEKLGVSMSSVESQAENMLGGFSGLQDALGADLAAYNTALSELGGNVLQAETASGVIAGLNTELENNNSEINKAIVAQNSLNNLVGLGANNTATLSTEVANLNFVLGENTRMWVANAIAQSADFKEMSKNTDAMNAITNAGFSLDRALQAAAGGSLDEYLYTINQAAQANASPFERAVNNLYNLGNSVAVATDDMGFFGDILTVIAGKIGYLASFIPRLINEFTKLFGLDLFPVSNGIEAMGIAAQGAVNQMAILGPAAQTLNAATASKNGDAYAKQLDNIKDSAAGAGREIRTVVDYANDLSSVFARTFEINFGRQEGLDSIASGWAAIADEVNNSAEAIANAKEQIAQANAEIASLTADKSVLQYQLTVAERYGDEARAAIIRAKIAKIDENIAGQKENISDATKDMTDATKDDNKTDIAKRALLLDQVKKYADLLEMYAKTGMKKKGLTKQTELMKAEFIKEAEAMGLSKAELAPYVAMFDDLGIAIKKTPRNVNVGFNSNISAADQAVKEYLAKLNKVNGTYTSTIKVVLPDTSKLKKIVDSFDYRLLLRAFEEKSISARQFYKAVYGIDIQKLASGGPVRGPGSGTSDSVPAMLSNGEYVVKASAVSAYGVDFFNSLNQQKVASFGPSVGVSAAAGGSTIAYLSPEDRSLLRAVIDRPVNLYTENAKIASSANAGNVVLAQRGTN